MTLKPGKGFRLPQKKGKGLARATCSIHPSASVQGCNETFATVGAGSESNQSDKQGAQKRDSKTESWTGRRFFGTCAHRPQLL